MIADGRVALVTGGGRGIGRAVALRLANEGANVAISYRSNDASAEEAAEEVRMAGVECEVFKGDVASPEDVKALFDGVGDVFGRIDILVNNAGLTRDNLMMRMKEAEFDDVIATNLKGTYLCTRAALRPMIRARWGRIINVSSVVGLVGNAGQANYAASKAGMIGMSKALAQEVATRGITVNCVAPGFIESAMTGKLNDKQREAILGTIPAGRLGTGDEIAAAVAYLASDEAAYVTGQTLHVNGGMAMI